MLCLINALPPFVTLLLSIFRSTEREGEQEKLIRSALYARRESKRESERYMEMERGDGAQERAGV